MTRVQKVNKWLNELTLKELDKIVGETEKETKQKLQKKFGTTYSKITRCIKVK